MFDITCISRGSGTQGAVLCFSSGPALPFDEVAMQIVYDLAPVIAEIISGHCAGTRAREDFVHACLHDDWHEAKVMVEGMLAEPWHLIGHQERRLREFLDLLHLRDGTLISE